MDNKERRQAIMELGKHKYTEDIAQKEKEFFLDYNEEMTEEQARERYSGIYGSDKTTVLSKKTLKKIWDKFVLEERIDYITRNNQTSMDDIVRIGIDKFIRTNGWDSPKDVSKWRTNVVRVGKCPECENQFIPLIMQTNHGLCNDCRPNFSVSAIKKFVEYTIATSPRYHKAHQDALMDFYIMFYSDRLFRKLFIKDSETAIEIENRVFEMPDWFKEAQEREMAIAQQKLVQSVPESESTDEKK